MLARYLLPRSIIKCLQLNPSLFSSFNCTRYRRGVLGATSNSRITTKAINRLQYTLLMPWDEESNIPTLFPISTNRWFASYNWRLSFSDLQVETFAYTHTTMITTPQRRGFYVHVASSIVVSRENCDVSSSSR